MPKGVNTLRIAVFCSSRADLNPLFFAAAKDFARVMVKYNWELIYGGAKVGLMGCFADAVLAAGGVARGAITRDLMQIREVAHEGLHELVVTDDLFERKKWFMEQADVFVIFPGGFGTLDEALEVITWKALGLHTKPILFVNIENFWQHLQSMFAALNSENMIQDGGLQLYQFCSSVDETVNAILSEIREDGVGDWLD